MWYKAARPRQCYKVEKYGKTRTTTNIVYNKYTLFNYKPAIVINLQCKFNLNLLTKFLYLRTD